MSDQTCVCDAFCYEEEGPCFVPGHDSTAPHRTMTFAEVVDDYVLVRGDLGEEYAREQLVDEHRRRMADRVRGIKNQRDLLASAMWDTRASFGFDTDGDKRYHTEDYGHISESFRRDMAEVRQEILDLNAEVVEGDDLRVAVAALADQWAANAGDDRDAESKTLRVVAATLHALVNADKEKEESDG